MINEHQEQLNINHNIGDAANNMLKIVVTEVESQPCASPYCDQIIAVEKAILRDGHCVECYNQLVRQEAWEAGEKPHKIGFYIFLALLVFYICRVAYLITTIFVFDARPTIILQLYIEPLIAITALMIGTHFSISKQKAVEKSRDLYRIQSVRKENLE